MGTTATSLHILSPAAAVSLGDEVEKAYRKLGYTRQKKADAPAPKRVIVSGKGPGDFVTILDSDNDSIDSGELKDLAVDLSRRLKTVAILTTVLDSDSFEFIVWRAGKQVDAAVSDAASHGGGLKMASGKRRAQLWLEMFHERDVRRAMAAGGAGLASFAEYLASWRQRLGVAEATSDSVFAEDGLMRWCDLAGIDADAALSRANDAGRPEAADDTILLLARTREPARKAAGSAPPPLAFFREDEDLPYHRVHPAAWPVEPDAPTQFRWFVVASGPGMHGVRLALNIEAASPLRVTGVHMRAQPFFNGQVTSMDAVASRDWTGFDIVGAGHDEQIFEDGDFTVPAVDPQSRKSFLVILRVEVALPDGSEATLTPRLSVLAPAVDGPKLPPLRLRADRPGWQPVVSHPPLQYPAPQDEAVRRLNAPAVRSMVAVLNGDGAPSRDGIRALAETWFGKLAPPAGTVATVHTEKHMTASASVSKSTQSLPFADLLADRKWPKLFDAQTDYQTVTVEIALQGAPYPLAGLVMQSTLRGIGGAPGLRPATLSGAIWMIDHPDIERHLGLTADDADTLFETWIAGVAPCQGWRTRAAWIPAFSRYDGYEPTLYEQAATVEWFRLGLMDQLMDATRLGQRLRFVSPLMWLGAELMQAIDASRLQEAATLARQGETTRVTLRSDRSLADLEQALAAILPRNTSSG